MTVQPIQRISARQSPPCKTTDPPPSTRQFKEIARPTPAKRPADRPDRTERRGHDAQPDQSVNKHATSHHGGLLAQPDGSFIVGHFSASIPPARAASFGAAQHVSTPALESETLQNVKVGQAGGTVRLHGTLAIGQHRGVELRAVETHGKVHVELVAQDPDAARSLRADLGDIRELLSKRGLDGVEVTVTTQSNRSAEPSVEQSAASANTGRHPQQDSETADETDQNHNSPVSKKSASQQATQNGQETADVEEAWEIL